MKKIMIVDDEPISLQMTNHILSTEYHTVCAGSGDDAIRFYEKEKPDMILSDLRMPGMDGFTLQETLQKQYERQIPFMFMTADHDEETESKGFENGAMDFIRKPFRADVLLRRVSIILASADQANQIQDLKEEASTDPMTGLLNKTSSREEIDRMVHVNQGVLMMIDLDSFKPVNDIYGHDMGDRILIRFAEIIKSSVRSTDLVGRMGGDEFIAFCQGIRDEAVIERKTKYINDEILKSAKEFMGEDMSIPLGASIGCAMAPDEGDDFDELFKKADKALYEVKQNGKHGYSVYSSNTSREKEDDNTPMDISSLSQIFEERTKAPGAYVIPFETFPTVYRFLKRIHARSGKEVWFLLFKIDREKQGSIPVRDACDKLFDILCQNLRQSDVVSRNGSNQFMVLLYETQLFNIEIVVDRLLESWSEYDKDDQYTLFYELKELQ